MDALIIDKPNNDKEPNIIATSGNITSDQYGQFSIALSDTQGRFLSLTSMNIYYFIAAVTASNTTVQGRILNVGGTNVVVSANVTIGYILKYRKESR